MALLTSRQRVLRTLVREEVDRVPVDVELTGEMRDKLLFHFGFRDEEEIFRLFGRDFRRVTARYTGPECYAKNGQPSDVFGVASGGPTYADTIGFRPFARVESVTEIESYSWPNPDWWDYSDIPAQCERFREYAVTGGEWSPFFCQACNMTGIGRFLELMLEAPEIAEAILSHIVDFYVAASRRYFEAARGRIDIFFVGDDYGGKNGMLMSPALWRALIKPQVARLYALAGEYGVHMMQHSCGSIRPVIGDLIELGLEVLDPVQIAAADMNPEGLKAEFGDRLTFHGGVNTEDTLPFGTPADVFRETRYLMDTLGDGGGYVVCGSQYLQADIPIANVIAMYQAAGSISPEIS
ncbi:MAG TPA: uroporphyrinogen decarboxylase family protein [Candidatus Latescibacteria bacterium]|nr:uroporphyrinogen decarboxylase family protein [Candidatus Latescibacterota bacterium]